MNRLYLCILLVFVLMACKYETKPVKQDIVVCLTFDDNCKSVYTDALPIMQQYGYRGTTFVNSGRIGNPAYCTWQQLIELKQTYHWEIGGHTLHHKHLSTLSPDDAEFEISADFDSLSHHGLNPVSFATPFGECPADYYRLITKYYKNVRTTMNSSMRSPIDRTLIGSYWVGSNASPKSLINRVQNGIADNESLVTIFFHDIATSDNTTYENSYYNPEKFREFVEMLHQMNVKVLPLNEAIDYLND